MVDPFSDHAPEGCHPLVGSSRHADEHCVCAELVNRMDAFLA
jgi:hypothetical protein